MQVPDHANRNNQSQESGRPSDQAPAAGGNIRDNPARCSQRPAESPKSQAAECNRLPPLDTPLEGWPAAVPRDPIAKSNTWPRTVTLRATLQSHGRSGKVPRTELQLGPVSQRIQALRRTCSIREILQRPPAWATPPRLKPLHKEQNGANIRALPRTQDWVVRATRPRRQWRFRIRD